MSSLDATAMVNPSLCVVSPKNSGVDMSTQAHTNVVFLVQMICFAFCFGMAPLLPGDSQKRNGVKCVGRGR